MAWQYRCSVSVIACLAISVSSVSAMSPLAVRARTADRTVRGVGARVVGAVAVLCLVGTACGHRRDAVTTAVDDEPPPTAASPFLVDGVPDGFRLEVAGRGTTSQEWGGDSFGSDEPFTVLAPPGADPGGPEAVIVSVTGYAG